MYVYIRVQNNIIMKKHINVNVNINIHIKIIFIGEITLFTILNYAPDYTLHHKLFERTLCILNYHTLHLDVIFAIMFNEILLHVTSTCFLFMRNKLKRLKHPSSKSIKTKANFSTSLLHACLSPNSNSCKL